MAHCMHCGQKVTYIGMLEVPVPAGDCQLTCSACEHCDAVFVSEYLSYDGITVTSELDEDDMRQLLAELPRLTAREPHAEEVLRRILASLSGEDEDAAAE